MTSGPVWLQPALDLPVIPAFLLLGPDYPDYNSPEKELLTLKTPAVSA